MYTNMHLLSVKHDLPCLFCLLPIYPFQRLYFILCGFYAHVSVCVIVFGAYTLYAVTLLSNLFPIGIIHGLVDNTAVQFIVMPESNFCRNIQCSVCIVSVQERCNASDAVKPYDWNFDYSPCDTLRYRPWSLSSINTSIIPRIILFCLFYINNMASCISSLEPRF